MTLLGEPLRFIVSWQADVYHAHESVIRMHHTGFPEGKNTNNRYGVRTLTPAGFAGLHNILDLSGLLLTFIFMWSIYIIYV